MPLTLAQMHALFNDNAAGDISAADGRSVITGLYELGRGTTPVSGDFSWVNQDGATVTVNSRGSISLTKPFHGATSMSCRVKSAPSAPYTITARLDVWFPDANFMGGGLVFRESGTGELVTFGVSYNSGRKIDISHLNSPTSFNTSPRSFVNTVHPLWLRIADDNTNRKYNVSMDGETFIEVYSEGRTTFLTADQVGFFVSSEDNAGPDVQTHLVLHSWDEA